jgi:uncharacterized protein (DUF2235 family)
MRKRIVICADGTMNSAFQTTRGGDQVYRPFNWKSGLVYHFIALLVSYWAIQSLELKLWSFQSLLIALVIWWVFNNLYLQILRRFNKELNEDERKKLIWRFYATRGSRTPSHVGKVFRNVKPVAIEPDGSEMPQIMFYDKGIGTGGLSDAIIGGAFGVGVRNNVLDCYDFLVQNYVPGDEIFLFGFSRGAFTVRVLAGMIEVCGLLSKEDSYYGPEAYEIFKLQASNKAEAADLLQKFRASDKALYTSRNHPTIDVEIKFMGVWDTVPAIGLAGMLGRLGGWFGKINRMNEFNLGKNVLHAYQALGLDENRRAFDPLLWSAAPKESQFEQKWFIGNHTSIGGGFHKDGISFYPFEWIVKKAVENGLAFIENKLDSGDRESQENNIGIDWYLPKRESYKEDTRENPWVIYPVEGFWKKRVVRRKGESEEVYRERLQFSDRLRIAISGTGSVNPRVNSREVIHESVYQRLNDEPDPDWDKKRVRKWNRYKQRIRVAEIPRHLED